MSDDNISREEFNLHMKHVRDSLHGINNNLNGLTLLHSDTSVIKNEVSNIKNQMVIFNEKSSELDKDVIKMKNNQKWVASIFLLAQTLITTWFTTKK